MRKYIFDIDGTLTPSRLPMDKGFEKFFTNWISNKNVYLVTGSDKAKTVEQIGTRVWSNVTKVYQSCGNQVWKNGKLISENDFSLTKEMENELIIFLKNTTWKEKFGNHVEQRVGLVNFSIIGRNCPQNKRTEYYNWDNIQKERLNICNRLMQLFPEIEASVGGEISIDIHKRGGNKSQILNEIDGEIYFFGDKMEKGGNDYPIAERLIKENRPHKLFKVKNPHETWERLKKIN